MALFPDALDPAFKLDGVKLTPYNLITSYNNFYEWGLSKEDPQQLANRGWKTEPWTIEIGGLCAKPARFDVNDLIKAIGGINNATTAIVVGMVDGHSLGRFPAGETGRHGRAKGRGEIRQIAIFRPHGLSWATLQ